MSANWAHCVALSGLCYPHFFDGAEEETKNGTTPISDFGSGTNGAFDSHSECRCRPPFARLAGNRHAGVGFDIAVAGYVIDEDLCGRSHGSLCQAYRDRARRAPAA